LIFCKNKNSKKKSENEKSFKKIIEQEKTISSNQQELCQLKEKLVNLENYNEECIFQKRLKI